MPRSPITTRMRSRPSEKPHAGTCSPEEHPDQAVVAAAAAEAAGQIRHRDLHDRAGVVRQPARQARIELHVPARRCPPRQQRRICSQSSTAAAAAGMPADELPSRARIDRQRALERVEQAWRGCGLRRCRAVELAARRRRAPILSSLSSATSASPCRSRWDARGIEQRRSAPRDD